MTCFAQLSPLLVLTAGRQAGAALAGEQLLVAGLAAVLGVDLPAEDQSQDAKGPSMDSSFSEQSIDGVARSIRGLFNDSGGRNMPRVLTACTGFWHVHCEALTRICLVRIL